MAEDSDLRYIDVEHLDSPAGRLDGMMVVNASNAVLGQLDGIVVDPIQRQVRAYVLECAGPRSRRRYLVPAAVARLDRAHNTIAMDLDDDEVQHLSELAPQDIPAFSDDDLMAALFRSEKPVG